MKVVVSMITHRLSFWKSDIRVIVSFVLGFGISIIFACRYISFCRAAGSPVQLMEMFDIAGSVDYVMPGILLGALLLVSDAPFVSGSTPYEILRTGKKRWICSSVAYLVVCCTLYFLAIAFAFAIMAAASGNVSFTNRWSTAMKLLAERDAQFAISIFKIQFYYPNYFHTLTPYGAFLRTLLFNNLYALVLAMCIFAFNLFARANCGSIIAFTIHIIGTVIEKEPWLSVSIGKFSLLQCAMPAFHFEEGMSTLYALIVLTVPTILLIFFCIRFSHLLEPFQKSKL